MHWIFEPSPLSRRMLGVLRIVAGLVFISFGTMKLIGYPPSPQPMPAFDLMSEHGIAGMLETFGGCAILLGLLTRPVAFILSGEMAVAYFHGHAPHGFWPVLNGGHPAVLFCFLWLFFSAAGGGPWSLDAALRRQGPSASGART